MKKAIKISLYSIGAVLGVAALVVGNFLLANKLDNKAIEQKEPRRKPVAAKNALLLPSQFINGERFYIQMQAGNGDSLLAYGDSGGGLCMILPATLDKLQISNKVKHGLMKGIMPMKYIAFSDVVTDPNIPVPQLSDSKILRRPFARVMVPHLLIPPEDAEMKFIKKNMPFDIFLGQNYFMGKAWTFDYPQRQIWVNTPLAATEEGKPGVEKLGFKKNAKGACVYGHPRMYIVVNGETIKMLFDTGATMILSENGKKMFGTTEKTIGGSFIAASIFDRWRKEHPEWKYYEKADMKHDVIEVPKVTIAGNEVGPVLFAKRPDEAWSEGMIHSMDSVVKGAVGGSAFKYLKVTIDYNTALAKFER